MLVKILLLPFNLVKNIIGLIFKIIRLLFSGVFGILRFIVSRMFGTVFGALIGFVIGTKFIGRRSNSKKKEEE
jgi:hypothetical protein